MKKALLIAVVILMLCVIMAPTVAGASGQSNYKIKTKYDGSVTLISVYAWDR